ncbi:MAG: hypothetical protein MUQ32_07280 [Chloroflexi bacterium]|nr:hypothetical protein [Chloroflexota bacterium]
MGLWHREPTAARAAGVAGARPPSAEPLPVDLLVRALESLVTVVPPPAPPPETIRRTITLGQRASVIRRALAGADVVVLQDLLRGVHDRVVAAITFLALLELMKRREIIVEQDEPWGPIMIRQTTVEERAAAGVTGRIDEEAPLDESLESFA